MAKNPGTRVQCVHKKDNGERCGNYFRISPATDPATATCHLHGNVKKARPQAEVGGRITQTWLTKEAPKVSLNDSPEKVERIMTMANTDVVELDVTDEQLAVFKVEHPDVPFYIAGTGTRQLKLKPQEYRTKAFEWMCERVRRSHERYPSLVIISGMAEGFDEMLALAAIEVGVPFWAYIPNPGYADYYWRQHSLTGRDRMDAFMGIVEKAAGIQFSMCPNERVLEVWEKMHPNVNAQRQVKGLYLEGKHSNFVRNDDMVRDGDAFYVWDPSSRGTAQCLQSIKQAKKPYEICNTVFEATL